MSVEYSSINRWVVRFLPYIENTSDCQRAYGPELWLAGAALDTDLLAYIDWL